MSIKNIDEFVKSTINIFEMMVGCTPAQKPLSIERGTAVAYDLTGVIGLSGKIRGSVIATFSRPVAFQAAECMLGMEVDEINEDVVDTVGELTNMIAGSAKKELSEYSLSLGIPNVFIDPGPAFTYPRDIQGLVLDFETPWGPFALDVGLGHDVIAVEHQDNELDATLSGENANLFVCSGEHHAE